MGVYCAHLHPAHQRMMAAMGGHRWNDWASLTDEVRRRHFTSQAGLL